MARDPQPDDDAGRPAGPRDHAAWPDRALVAHPGAAVASRSLPDRAAAHPDGRSVRLLRGLGDGRPGHLGRGLPAPRAAARLAAPGGPARGQPRLAGAHPPDDAAGDDRAAVRARRRDEPDPLEDDRPPRRDPGQGVRPRADRRCLDRARPPAQRPGRARRRIRRSRRRSGRRPRSPTRPSRRTAPSG